MFLCVSTVPLGPRGKCVRVCVCVDVHIRIHTYVRVYIQTLCQVYVYTHCIHMYTRIYTYMSNAAGGAGFDTHTCRHAYVCVSDSCLHKCVDVQGGARSYT